MAAQQVSKPLMAKPWVNAKVVGCVVIHVFTTAHSIQLSTSTACRQQLTIVTITGMIKTQLHHCLKMFTCRVVNKLSGLVAQLLWAFGCGISPHKIKVTANLTLRAASLASHSYSAPDLIGACAQRRSLFGIS
jgi:hypothetical protein